MNQVIRKQLDTYIKEIERLNWLKGCKGANINYLDYKITQIKTKMVYLVDSIK